MVHSDGTELGMYSNRFSIGLGNNIRLSGDVLIVELARPLHEFIHLCPVGEVA